MDKKNTIIGVGLLLAAVAVFKLAPRSPEPTRPANAQVATSPTASTTATASPSASAPAGATAFAPINKDAANAQVTTLANDFIEARLTNYGGAIRDVAFKQYPAVQGRPEPYVFNQLHEDPILALGDIPGLGRETAYQLVSATKTEVVYRAVLDGKVEVTRKYQLTDPSQPGGDPYRLHHETTFRNLTDAAYPLPATTVSIGTTTLVNSADRGYYLNVASYDGKSFTFTDRGALQGGGIGSLVGSGRPVLPVLELPGPVVWAAAKNQFFASIFTPNTPANAVIIHRIELPPFPDSKEQNIGLTGAERFHFKPLAAHGAETLAGDLYVGPKEYKRLANFAHNEDGVMQYTRGMYRYFLSGYVAPLENWLMNAAHRWSGNWGVAVILMTLMLKTISLPFTLAASRSARRMSKLQPEMKALREKYKDNPQKQQMATMELFKAHKVNPLGGCIPVLITMPLFFGFYAMLAGAAELRFQPFLWATDLSAPDTVGHLLGFPVNVMPLLMGVTTLVQMQLTPTPSVDNAQATMMKIMPLVFVAFCYNYSCALAIYMTVNGLFTIGQQLVINRMRDDGDPANQAAAGRSGKPMKNVTPRNKGLKR